jgi:hypothetical protein
MGKSSLFESATIAQMAQNFKTLLTAVVADPGLSIGDIGISI